MCFVNRFSTGHTQIREDEERLGSGRRSQLVEWGWSPKNRGKVYEATRLGCLPSGGGRIDTKRTKSFEELIVRGPSRELPEMHVHKGSKEWSRHEFGRRGRHPQAPTKALYMCSLEIESCFVSFHKKYEESIVTI